MTLNGYLSNKKPQNGLPSALNTLDIEPTVDKNLSLFTNVSPNALIFNLYFIRLCLK